MLQSSVLFILLVLSVANCQFFYNYEEDRPEVPLREPQNYDPPSEPQNQPMPRRTRIRVRSRNYNSDPDYNQSQEQSSADQRVARQERRQARRINRAQDYVEPTLAPRIYSPSIFEKIGLGEAPNGVYIPENSFLNVLRNPSQRNPVSYSIPQPAPQPASYVQPAVNYVNNEPQPRFFVQPPSNEEPRQTGLILPITRSQIEYAEPTPRQQSPDINIPQNVPARPNRRNRQRVRSQPTVDIDSLREYTDDVGREDIQVVPKVEYVPISTRPQSRRRTVTTYQVTPAPRVYSPSIFEKVGLGEAPNGVYVPEDSLLNILRNPSVSHASASRPSRREQLEAQPTYNAQDDYVPDVIEEEPYQPLPPPPPPPRRRPSLRNRQTLSERRTERRNDHVDQLDARLVQTSSQRRSQRRDDDYDDFARQSPPVQRQTQTQRRPAPASRQQTQQTSTSQRDESSGKRAKLAIAALPIDTDDDGIPGEAGTDYPTYHVIPKTTFSCSQQPHNGYYADLEASCQVVHMCQAGGVKSSYLCPNGTIFSQEKFSCQWWYKVNCNESPDFYIKNEELYKVPEKKTENEKRKRN